MNTKTEKMYKKAYVPIKEWKGLTEMLEAAYQFTQQKAILKKS